MRHRHTIPTLDRNRDARQALLRGLATNLVLRDKIRTTTAKAKAVKPIVERLVTIAKTNNLTARRRLVAYLYTDGAVRKMLEVIGPRYTDRSGGYTRIIKTGPRKGDGGDTAILEFV
ncbi:MAG: 50S ribosomal protein L17 [Patescibacteria group bacterium]